MKETIKSITADKYIVAGLFLVLAILPVFSSLYTTQLMGKIITFIILALALDILWGYGGLMNLGFAVFFGLGGYITGIALACRNGLPAFMKAGGLEELPWFYRPLENMQAAIVLSVLLPALLALFLGYFIFTSKIKGVFFNLITLAFAALFELFIKTNQVYTGGSSGVNGVAKGLKDIALFGNTIDIRGWYYIAFVSLVIIYFFCLWLTESRFGKVVKSVRDNEARLQFLGYNPAVFKMALFAIAGAIAGFGGALYVPITSFISIENAGITFSTILLIWLAVGGRGSLSGAIFGTLTVSLLQSKLSGVLGDFWQIVLGLLLIAIVLILPKGIIGTIIDMQYNSRIVKELQKKDR
ncbi:ABC transporter permease subunit [Kineothrix sedimenti]|uniref:Urea transport system permease protein n=1 Tax=Kineothrix sedimenti TaxID=3123317 RepID=A0ABZ3EXH8_9FIRM